MMEHGVLGPGSLRKEPEAASLPAATAIRRTLQFLEKKRKSGASIAATAREAKRLSGLSSSCAVGGGESALMEPEALSPGSLRKEVESSASLAVEAAYRRSTDLLERKRMFHEVITTKNVRAMRKSGIRRRNGSEQTKTAAAAVAEGPSTAAPTINTPPLPAPYPPFSMTPAPKAFPKPVVTKAPWELRISKLCKTDPRRYLPTVMGPPDPITASDVISSRDKELVQDVARSIVTIIYHCTSDVSVFPQRHFTGFVVGLDHIGGHGNQARKHVTILTCYAAISKTDPKPKLQVLLPDGSILEAKLLFFNMHYDIALLEILLELDISLFLPCFGSNPNYGQKVLVLGRDETYLTARRGSIEWFEQTDYLGRHCHMFLSCEVPLCGRGGPVIDTDGNVIGMVLETFRPNPPMLAISTIFCCIEMWIKFSCIPRPMHGLRLRTVELLEVSLREKLLIDHNISGGYIVDDVSKGYAAENLGLRSGEVIISFEGHHNYTLPELEDFLLSLGGACLESITGTSLSYMVYAKLEVYNPLEHKKRHINLPIKFSVAPETEKGKKEAHPRLAAVSATDADDLDLAVSG